MHIFYTILCLLLLSNTLFAKPSPSIKKALDASWQVIIVGVATGSGVAIAHLGPGTLIMTNDHVCQSSRGINPISQSPKFSSKLNSRPIFIQNLKVHYPAKVVMTANTHLLKAPSRKSDLCLLYVEVKVPTIAFAEQLPEPGSDLFGIGAPSGFFPSIYKGFAGAQIEWGNIKPTDNPSLFVTVYANHGSSGGGLFNESGELVAITYAIALDDSNKSPVITLAVPLIYVEKFLSDYLNFVKEHQNAK